jgi:MinD-like ATPase involved in chromosome partitioning or flagellar assembly
MAVIALANLKGGVGKTTIVLGQKGRAVVGAAR